MNECFWKMHTYATEILLFSALTNERLIKANKHTTFRFLLDSSYGYFCQTFDDMVQILTGCDTNSEYQTIDALGRFMFLNYYDSTTQTYDEQQMNHRCEFLVVFSNEDIAHINDDLIWQYYQVALNTGLLFPHYIFRHNRDKIKVARQCILLAKLCYLNLIAED